MVKGFSIVSYTALIVVTVVISIAAGVMAADPEFNHPTPQIKVYDKGSIVPLLDEVAYGFGTPANLDCGRNGCLKSINTDGRYNCLKPRTRIFGGGTCIKVSRTVATGKKGKSSVTEHGFYCQQTKPGSGGKTATYWAFSNGGQSGALDRALNDVISGGLNFCPTATTAKKHSQGYYCQE